MHIRQNTRAHPAATRHNGLVSIPTDAVDVPERVRALAGTDPLVPVWRNGIGGLTFRAGRRFIKWGPLNSETTMADEARRLAWAGAHIRVPRVREQGVDAQHEWMVTDALPGKSAVAPRWVADAATAVRAIGTGLRTLHNSLPTKDCPFSWQVGHRVAKAEARGIRVPAHLTTAPPIDRLVVCHGDACAPNTLIGDDGQFSAHVDLGALGVADRWADIAVAAMSTEWNYGPGWEDALIEAYGLDPDRRRLAFYRDLWNAT